MKNRLKRVQIGPRTVKTALAVILAMMVADRFGMSASKYVFAMLGAMAAMEPTLKDSAEACIVQTASLILGGIVGVLLLLLKLPMLVTTGIGIVFVITVYNACRLRFSPSLACLIVVTLCTASVEQPVLYAAGRVWDTAIGLTVGLAVNALVFPYDNSNQIRRLLDSLDREVILFLENMFDGDDVLPDAEKMTAMIDDMARQLKIFSNQWLIMRLRRQKEELEQFRCCEGKARELLARMEVLSRMGRPGRLNDENRQRLKICGAQIRDTRPLKNPLERDVVTNYHVRQMLMLRQELLDTLKTLNIR